MQVEVINEQINGKLDAGSQYYGNRPRETGESDGTSQIHELRHMWKKDDKKTRYIYTVNCEWKRKGFIFWAHYDRAIVV